MIVVYQLSVLLLTVDCTHSFHCESSNTYFTIHIFYYKGSLLTSTVEFLFYILKAKVMKMQAMIIKAVRSTSIRPPQGV